MHMQGIDQPTICDGMHYLHKWRCNGTYSFACITFPLFSLCIFILLLDNTRRLLYVTFIVFSHCLSKVHHALHTIHMHQIKGKSTCTNDKQPIFTFTQSLIASGSLLAYTILQINILCVVKTFLKQRKKGVVGGLISTSFVINHHSFYIISHRNHKKGTSCVVGRSNPRKGRRVMLLNAVFVQNTMNQTLSPPLSQLMNNLHLPYQQNILQYNASSAQLSKRRSHKSLGMIEQRKISYSLKWRFNQTSSQETD